MFVLLFGVFPVTYATGTQKRPGLCTRTSWRLLKPLTLPRLPVPASSRATARSPSGARIADRLLPPVAAVSSIGYSPLLPLVNRVLHRSCSDPTTHSLRLAGPMATRRGSLL